MSAPPALVLRTAGTNCDAETVRALEQAGARPLLVHADRLAAEPSRLDEVALLVLPGGFSHGDDIAAGRVFGFELRLALGERLRAFVARGGYVLGICNGFQVLVDTGLLDPPAPDRSQPQRRDREIALGPNASGRFECRWVRLVAERSRCSWLEPGYQLPCPVAHAEGRFAVRCEQTLRRLESEGRIALRYAGATSSPPGYPDNPNGSAGAVAGLCDGTGRVLGLMPHPERNLTPWNHPLWTRLGPREEGEGAGFFRRLVAAAG